MSADLIPTTLVRDIMVSVEETLRLDAQDGPKEAQDKGLYIAPAGQPVVVYDGDAVIAVILASKLRHEELTRSWQAPLDERLARVGRPPQITAQTRAVDLLFLVQDNEKLKWLAVVDDETGELVGVLDRGQVLKFRPPPDPTEPIWRISRLYGVAGVQNVYYYCKVENRIYGPNAVHRDDADGQMRDRRGHLVKLKEPPRR
jgi:hypothetical protein